MAFQPRSGIVSSNCRECGSSPDCGCSALKEANARRTFPEKVEILAKALSQVPGRDTTPNRLKSIKDK
jgi:hypothetical protein